MFNLDPRAARSPSEFDRETPQLRGGVVNAIEVTLRYVRHHDIERYLRAGWMITHDMSDC